ncbi:hypothetical protein BDY17DRAFT_322563 [Neohortaea acidophila]|uniref:F-box domain-containing protein n=1 Tax=Neohortaea acidophila TaxID=245834 RepID=A0A6A6Q2U2_9PEZI|nr:uncharacterized protein BDY17DRAFT_322563 [Neohortaea acidophila]KAF2485747.1 hypothetical protein BDY17DRAFT_322563 [Neohortaea acidophila]
MALSLLSIPAELQVTIIGNLDAKSIQRARSVSCKVRDLIDTHKASLVKTVLWAENARLQAFLDHHDYSDLSIVQAFSRWMKHRAVEIETFTGPFAPCVFMIQFMRSRAPTCLLAQAEKHEVTRIAWMFVWEHALKKLYHDMDGETDWTPGKFVRDLVGDEDQFKAYHADRFSSINRDHLYAILKEAAAHPDLFERETLAGTLHGHDYVSICSPYHYCPARRLTKIAISGPVPGLGFPGEIISATHRGGDEIPEVLHAPSLPQGRVFAYFASDEWAFGKIVQALGGAPMDPLLKAALLEKLFIF